MSPVEILRSPVEILRRWIAAINDHDVGALSRLMSADFSFVDSLGQRVNSGKSMEGDWRGYFAMCPDYWIRADQVMGEGDTLLIAGEAGGTIDGETWKIPGAWRAVIRHGSILEWQVVCR